MSTKPFTAIEAWEFRPKPRPPIDWSVALSSTLCLFGCLAFWVTIFALMLS